MSKYLIAVDGKQDGPYEVTELAGKGLTADTLVWTEGMTEWQPAGNIPELTGYITPVQPLQNMASSQELAMQPKTYLVESILVTIFCCLPFGIVGIIKASSVSSKFQAGLHAEAVQASKDAKKWTMWGFFIGLVIGIIYLCVYGVIGYAAFTGKLQ